MTDTIVATPLFTPGMTAEAMRAAEGGAAAVLLTVREQWLAWCRETHQPDGWPTSVLGEGRDPGFWRDQLQTSWADDLTAFSQWATRHPERFRNPTTVPSGDTTIGPETPGWNDFWAKVRELAEEDGYEEQYNTLAQAFGAPVTEETEVEVDVEVRIDSFYVTIRRTMTRRQAENADDDLEAFGIDQGDIDEAVRDYIAHENVEYEHSETSIDV